MNQLNFAVGGAALLSRSGEALRFPLPHPPAAFSFMKRTDEERLVSFLQLNESSGCWEFCGGLNSYGYGMIGYGHRTVGAHRVAWLLWRGHISEHFLICHRCDNRRCCNPSHLFEGTINDNNQDCQRKGRMSCGINRSEAKLTEASVRDIKRRCIPNSRTNGMQALATEFRVNESTIRKIINGKKWRHIQ